jgi:hypothetical protein
MPLISDHALLTMGADHTLCNCSFGCNAASQRILSNHIGRQSANHAHNKAAYSAAFSFAQHFAPSTKKAASNEAALSLLLSGLAS